MHGKNIIHVYSFLQYNVKSRVSGNFHKFYAQCIKFMQAEIIYSRHKNVRKLISVLLWNNVTFQPKVTLFPISIKYTFYYIFYLLFCFPKAELRVEKKKRLV